MRTRIVTISLLIILSIGTSFAQNIKFSGQLSSWGILNPKNDFDGQIGARYIPGLKYASDSIGKGKIGAELSLNSYGVSDIPTLNKIESKADFKPYRMWVKYETNQFEIRTGLQKVNFGSANTIRPLMWFDQIDPTDPLKLTTGVYSVLMKYYFLNNANVWIWGMYGNDERRGLDTFITKAKTPEFGGRFQYPVLEGEIALTGHHRQVTINDEFSIYGNENRIALDGKWDALAGIWLEASYGIIENKEKFREDKYLITIGTDYTFGIGNGLTASTEFFYVNVNANYIEDPVSMYFSTLQMSYPISILDNLSMIQYYDWNGNLYNFLSWNRSYDAFSLNLMAFWNPEIMMIPGQESMNLFGGKGVQFMLVWNH